MGFLAGYRRNSQKIEIKYISRIFVDRASAKSRNFWSIIEAIIHYQIRWRDGRAERKKMEPESLWLQKWDSFQLLFRKEKAGERGVRASGNLYARSLSPPSFFCRLPFFLQSCMSGGAKGFCCLRTTTTHRLPRERKRKKEKVIALSRSGQTGFPFYSCPNGYDISHGRGRKITKKSTVSLGFQKNITSFSRKNCWNQPDSGSVSNTLFSQTGPSAPSPSFREWPSCFPRKITIYFRR